ncbi:MAG: cytochrome C biogenesis protein CcmH [Ponticaulis sp.]|nr:cytochrome C biogenesis protein CcmH [Ponticaulis sp.]
MIRALIAAFALILTAPAFAQDASLSDAEVEARTEEISKTLRCVVCQNQSIADSNATLAEDMRRLVESRVRAGESNEQVRAFMQERYGDFVLMTPPLKTATLILWFGPLCLVLAGLTWYILAIRKAPSRSVDNSDETLSEAEQEKLAALLDKEDNR